jgi:hypothetical protein
VTADNRVLSAEQALISAMLDAIEGYLTMGEGFFRGEKAVWFIGLLMSSAKDEGFRNWRKRYMK